MFDNGRLIFDAKVERVTLSESGRREARLGPKDPSEQFQVHLNLAYKPERAQPQYFDTGFFMKQTKKFLVGQRRFALTLVEIYEGTDTAEFQVQTMP